MDKERRDFEKFVGYSNFPIPLYLKVKKEQELAEKLVVEGVDLDKKKYRAEVISPC